MARLRIADRSKRTLTILAGLGEADFDQLLRSFEKASPDLYQGNLAVFIQDQVSLPSDFTRDLVGTLLRLYSVRSQRDIQIHEFAQDIVDSLTSDASAAAAVGSEEFKDRLIRLLGFEATVGITAKALDVMSDQQRIFCNGQSRVLSDIRPVFPNDRSSAPKAAVIVHTLKLAYHEEGEPKEIYVALDSRDIQELRRLLDQADKKADRLRDVIKAADMQYLDPEVHEHPW